MAANKDCGDFEEIPLTLLLFLQTPSGLIPLNMGTGVLFIECASVSIGIKYSFHV